MAEFFEIDFLETGNKGSGDAIAIRVREDSGLDYVYIVDGGYTDDGEKLLDHIRKYYDNPNLIDNVVSTHPDQDHASGLKTILVEYRVSKLWMNRPWNHVDELLPNFNYEYTRDGLIQRLKKDFPVTAELERIANEKGIDVYDVFQGQQIDHFTVLAPSYDRYIDLIVESEKTPEPQRAAQIAGRLFERAVFVAKFLFANWGEENLKGNSEGTSRENESSVIQYAEIRDKKILLTGDAGIEALEEAYDYAVYQGVELPGIHRFQVPHHGSRRNLSSEILDKWLGPKINSRLDDTFFSSIISANQGDKDHPKKATIRALVHRGASVVQTKGTICSYCNSPDRDGWSAVTPLEYPEDQEA